MAMYRTINLEAVLKMVDTSLPSSAVSPCDFREGSLSPGFLGASSEPFLRPLLFRIIFILITFAGSFMEPTVTLAQEGTAKSEKKAIQRWTLQEWLAQKERNKLMDQWLQMHTPTPYEFALELQQQDYAITSSTPVPHYKTLSGSLTAYATLVGLEFQHNNNANEGMIDNILFFHTRVLGVADQASHLTLSLGQKTRHYNNTLPLRTQLLGQVDLTLYLNGHFGFAYFLKSYYPITGDVHWGDLTGSEQKVFAFIEFEALRLFGGVYSEKESQTLGGTISKRSIQGSLAGIRLYF